MKVPFFKDTMEEIPMDKRWEHFHDLYSAMVSDMTLHDKAKGRDFEFLHQGFKFHDFALVEESLMPVVCKRPKRIAESDSLQYFMIGLNLGDDFRFGHNRGETFITAGDVYVCDWKQSHWVYPSGRIHGLLLYVTGATMHSIMPNPEGLHGKKLPVGTPGNQVLAGHMKSLFATGPLMEVEFANKLGPPTLDILATALGQLSSGVADISIDSREDFVLRRRATSYIRSHLQDPALIPELVSNELGVSRSRLYKCFEAKGGIMTFIRSLRLKKIHEEIAGHLSNGASAQEIAFKWGFKDYRNFRRYFKREYGLTPRELKSQAQSSKGISSFEVDKVSGNLPQEYFVYWDVMTGMV